VAQEMAARSRTALGEKQVTFWVVNLSGFERVSFPVRFFVYSRSLQSASWSCRAQATHFEDARPEGLDWQANCWATRWAPRSGTLVSHRRLIVAVPSV